MDNEKTLQAEILARLSSLEDKIIDMAIKINIIEGMGTIEENKKKIEDTKSEIIESLMKKTNARNKRLTDRKD